MNQIANAILARHNPDGWGEILYLSDEGAQNAYRKHSNAVVDYGVVQIKAGNALNLEPGRYHWVRVN